MSQAPAESIYIADYDPRWPQMYEEERARVLEAIGEWVAEIEHCGSTAVPALAAKPVIDAYAGLRSWDDREKCKAPLEAIGYEYRGEDPVIGQIFIKPTDSPLPGQTFRGSDGKIRHRTVNVHLLPHDHPEWGRHILFRDYLRQHPSLAHRYAELKRELAAKHGLDINAYTKAKSEFIEAALKQAREETPPDIYLAEYDPRWPQMFEEERARLHTAIGEWAADIQHVGSTSIPGIAAKPIIDIAVHLRSLVDALYCITPLMELGYECLGEFGIPGRIYFRKCTDQPLRGQSHEGVGRTHQIHMYERTNEQYEKQIVFRDYLRAHPDARGAYEALKRELAARHARDVEAYAMAKSEFVLDILARARAAAAARGPSSSDTKRGVQANR
jgi:GrpB-like predicted nucleotidyltransferase (UPF0157 family)